MFEGFLDLGIQFGLESGVPLGELGSHMIADSNQGLDQRWWRFLGRLHPLVVHFPIALSIAAAAVEFVNILRRKTIASPFAFTATVFAAMAACIAAWFGWLNADFENATPGNTLFLHRWLGVIAAGGLVTVAVLGCLGRSGSRPRALNGYRWGLVVCAILVGVGAHFGGTMVYGKGYLTKVLFAPTPQEKAEPAADPKPDSDANTVPSSSSSERAAAVSFEKDVLPILDARCVECHGPNKVKGGLRMDTAAALFSGDQEWWTVQPGDPGKSLLLKRIELPADDPDAMPPSGPRLTAAEISTIRTWIAQGAIHAGAETKSAPNESGVDVGVVVPDDGGKAVESLDDKATSALDASASSLRARKVQVAPIAEGASEWEVNGSHIDPPFADADMRLLVGLRPVLVWLQLSRSSVTDAGIETLAGFDRIRRLKLDHTTVGDPIVATLLTLPDLEMVNLYGTDITDEGIERLATHPGLLTIYCDGSKATAAGVRRVAAAHPGLEIVGPQSSEVDPTD